MVESFRQYRDNWFDREEFAYGQPRPTTQGTEETEETQEAAVAEVTLNRTREVPLLHEERSPAVLRFGCAEPVNERPFARKKFAHRRSVWCSVRPSRVRYPTPESVS